MYEISELKEQMVHMFKSLPSLVPFINAGREFRIFQIKQ
jgi:hypothetical protein